MTELIPLAKSGKIGKIGLSNHSLEEIKEAAAMELSAEEIVMIEKLGDEAQLNVIRYWEKEMK